MLHSRYIIVADFPGGKTVTVYQGADCVAADRAFAKAIEEGKAEAVVEFCHPMPNRVRHPLQEISAAEDRAKEGERREASERDARRIAGEGKRAQAEALLLEAEKLDAEAKANSEPAEAGVPATKPAKAGVPVTKPAKAGVPVATK